MQAPSKSPKNGPSDKLTAVNLKTALWNTLQGIRAGEISAGSGDAIASQAREILRTVRVQLAIFSQSGQSVTQEVTDFAASK